MSSRPARKHLATLSALLAYVAITIALTYPLIAQMPTGVPNDLGDPLLVGWVLWWNAHAVPFTDAFWNAPAFFPAPGVLGFSEHFMGVALISTPIYWLSGNIQLGYNVVFVLTFVLSAFFAYLLCRALTGREDAAFIGGLIYGFTPYRIDQLPHMQMLVSFWMPFGLLGLHRYLQTKRARWLAVFAVGWIMQGLSSGYLMMFFGIFVGGWICWFVPWREWRQWLTIGAVWAVASLALVPPVAGYRRIHEIYGFHRGIAEIEAYSADITGLFQAPYGVLAWRWLNVFPHAEGAIFPGITAALLIVLSLIVVRARTFTLTGIAKRIHSILGVVTVVFTVAALSAWLAPWQIPMLGLSNTHVDKPLRFGAWCLLVWIATHSKLVGAFKRRSAFAFYLAGAFVMWMLCLGPSPTYLGVKTPFTGPYALLLHLPGFDSLRVPGRFAMVTALCLACAGAIALGRLASALSRTTRITVTVVACALALLDGWTTMVIVPKPGPWPIQALESPGPVVELPLGDGFPDIEAMYRSTYTGNPTVNGYSGNFPPWYMPLTMGLQRHDPTVLEDLASFGVRQVVVDTRVENNRAWITYFESRPDIVLAGDDGIRKLYRLPASNRTIAVRKFGAAIPVVRIDATVNPQLIPAMTDGDVRTRWQSGPQQGTERVTLDLGHVQPIGGVVNYMGEFTSDAPKDLLVEISDDREHWTTISRGPGESEVLHATLRDPKRTPFTIDIGDRSARYIRLSQLGSDPVWYWTIAELGVFAPAR